MYKKGDKINEIAKAVGVSRRTLSDFFKTLSDTDLTERNNNKKQMRKEYQKNWDKTKRNREQDITYALVKRQHDIDVRVLSAERHFN